MKKICVFAVFFLLFSVSFSPVHGMNIKNKDIKEIYPKIRGNNDIFTEGSYLEKCYSIVVPLVQVENLSYTRIQYGISNLINDLLRMNVTVYWAAKNFSALSIGEGDTVSSTRLFKRGTFIVPFTGNFSKDVLITCIVHDYKSGSEIEEYFPVDVYHIMEPLSLDIYPLNAAKVAFHSSVNLMITEIFFYLSIIHSGGFLDNQLVSDDDIDEKLNNIDFNVYIWPGGFVDFTTAMKTSGNLKSSNAIRDFVNNGGGFIGSCYGAGAASSGMFLPFNLLQHRFKNLSALGFLSLISSSFIFLLSGAIVSVKLVNRSHPVSFGLTTIEKTFYRGGPIFNWIPKDTNIQTLGILEDVQILWNEGGFENFPQSFIEKYVNFIRGKPLWISSKFGEGKVVVFGDHPEVNFPNRNDRIVHNTLFYTTSGEKTKVKFDNSLMFSKIIEVYKVTDNLSLPEYTPVFFDIWKKIDLLNTSCKEIDESGAKIFTDMYRINELGKHENALLKRAKIFHESYQQWIEDFSQALMKLERIYAQIQHIEEISSDVMSWKNSIVESLTNTYALCLEVSDGFNVFIEKIERYVGFSVEKLQIMQLFDNLGVMYREGYTFLIQLWSSVVKQYRRIWYVFEGKCAENPSIEHLNKVSIYNQLPSSVYENKYGRSRTIYVDDDAPVGGNGSIAYPYRRIQDALEASYNGDTVFVKSGIYYGRLYIDKQVEIIGEDKNTTIIDGRKRPHHLVFITQSHVKLSGFTIQNTVKVSFSCGLILYSSHNTIRGNIFKNNCIGLGFNPDSGHNTIKGNIFINNHLMGIGIDEVTQTNNTISENVFVNNTICGLYTINNYNIINNNVFINDGILIAFSDKSVIPEIIDNTVNGRPLLCYKNCNNVDISNAGQIILSNCTNVTIEQVDLCNLEVGLQIFSSSNIYVQHSEISHNLIGISLQDSNDVKVIDNDIDDNSWCGIFLYNSINNYISNNLLNENSEGIFLSSSQKNNIESNKFITNIVGISFWSSSENNRIYENRFIGNYENVFNKYNNYWKNNFWDEWFE